MVFRLNSVYLRRHVKEQHNKNNDVTVNCPTCNKVIRNKRLLAQHIRSVHCELKHKCTLCDKAFKSPKNLKVKTIDKCKHLQLPKHSRTEFFNGQLTLVLHYKIQKDIGSQWHSHSKNRFNATFWTNA